MKKKLALLLAAALVVGTLGACGSSSSTSAPAADGGDSAPAQEAADGSGDAEDSGSGSGIRPGILPVGGSGAGADQGAEDGVPLPARRGAAPVSEGACRRTGQPQRDFLVLWKGARIYLCRRIRGSGLHHRGGGLCRGLCGGGHVPG